MIDLEKIERMAHEKTIEDILKEFNWKEFEEVVGEIFKRNEFEVKKNLKIKTRRWYEIDLIAARRNFVFCVDCKRWSRGRYKKSGIKKSVEEQEKRARVIENFLKKNLLLKKNLNLQENFEVKPLIVTLFEEEIARKKNTFVIPVFKLNSFLLEFENFFD